LSERRKNRFFGLLSRFVDVKPGEEKIVLLIFAFFFLITAPHTIIKALRYTDFLHKVGSQDLPLAYLLAAVVTGLVVLFQSKTRALMSNRISIISSLIFFILTGLLFLAFLGTGGKALSYLYWIWANVLTVVLMTHFGLTVSETFNPRQARRLIGFCGSGGILGGVLGGFGAFLLTKAGLGEFLLPLACYFLFVCILVVNAIFKFREQSHSIRPEIQDKHPQPQKFGFKDSFDIVRKNHYLILIASIVIITGIIATFIDFQFSSKVGEHFVRRDAMQSFFGLFFGGLTTFAFFLQLLLTSRFLKNFGVRLTLLLAPIVLMFGSVGILVGGFTLPLVIFVKGSDESLAFSLNQSMREILYIPVPQDLRYKARPFIDMFINRFAKVTAAILLFVGGLLANITGMGVKEVPYLSPIKDPKLAEYLTWSIIAALFVWIVLNLKVSREYISVVSENIPLRWSRVDKTLTETVDIDYTKMVFDAVESRNRSSVLYAMHIFDLLKKDKLTPEIKKMISQKVDEVKVSSLSELFDAEGATWFPDIDDDISQESLITDIREIMSLDSYQKLMKIHADKVLEESKKSEIERMELAKAIGMMAPDSALVERLEALIYDDSPEVARYAIESAARLRKESLIPALIHKLNNPLIREDTISALKEYGQTALPILKDHLEDSQKDMDLRKAIVSVLAGMGTPQAAEILMRELQSKSGDLDADIIDALDRLRSEKPEIDIPEKVVKKKTFELIKQYCQAYIDLQEVKPGEKHEEHIKGSQRILDKQLANIFKLLGLYYPHGDILKAYQNLKADTKHSVAFAIELLDSTLKKDLRDAILPLVEDISPAIRKRKFQQMLRSL
jgi:AAA family ATP:ADP antiporter